MPLPGSQDVLSTPSADGPISNFCPCAQEKTLESVRSKVREETCIEDGRIHLVTARERHLLIEQSLHFQPCGIWRWSLFSDFAVRLAYTSYYCSWYQNPAKDVRISFVLFHVVEMVVVPLQLMQVVYIDIFRLDTDTTSSGPNLRGRPFPTENREHTSLSAS